MQLPSEHDETAPRTGTKIRILAGKLFNSDTLTFSENQVIDVDQESGLIVDVRNWSGEEENGEDGKSQIIDLRRMTILPGFVDVHVHRPKSSIYPHQEGINGVVGAESADGVDGCVREVRKQIGTGADWVKIYADYKPRSRILDVSPSNSGRSISTFNDSELRAMIDTVHSYGVKIAAHAQALSSFKRLLRLGIDSIEHPVLDYGSDPQADAIDNLFSDWTSQDHTTFWVPTLAVIYKMKEFTGGKDTRANAAWERSAHMFKRALEVGFDKIACGGDTGAFPHGENALELKLMVELGADIRKVLRWATLSGWECLRDLNWEMTGAISLPLGDNDVRFGCIKSGWAADIIAIDSEDIEREFEHALERVVFVMKGGKIYKGGEIGSS
ncbi:hypothetical protein V5O48_004154 [Marasmius crinis-equi]|uniref:Amidohydrolase-related domain-containing protein n=1 Tax=Marasmius crinis-equi TaxID=585013 RepID=A0ABR3FRE0_9AGAR